MKWLLQRSAKVQSRPQGKTVYLFAPVLTKVDFIKVSFEDPIFAVTIVDDQGDIGLTQFPQQGTIAGKENIFC